MLPVDTTLGTKPIVICAAAASLPFPPIVAGANVSRWNGARAVPEFDLELWSDATVSLTGAELFGGSLQADVVAANTFTVDHATEIVTTTSGLLHTGDGPIQLTNAGGALPAGLSTLTDYYWIRLSATTGYLAASLEDALASTKVLMTGNGTGTHTLTGTASCKLMKMMSCGLLGNAADGVVALTIRRGYNIRITHRPKVVMYWIAATVASGTGTIYSTIYAVQS